MKLVSWYDNEWGYRLESAAILIPFSTQRVNNSSDVLDPSISIQQPCAWPHRTHGPGERPSLKRAKESGTGRCAAASCKARQSCDFDVGGFLLFCFSYIGIRCRTLTSLQFVMRVDKDQKNIRCRHGREACKQHWNLCDVIRFRLCMFFFYMSDLWIRSLRCVSVKPLVNLEAIITRCHHVMFQRCM